MLTRVPTILAVLSLVVLAACSRGCKPAGTTDGPQDQWAAALRSVEDVDEQERLKASAELCIGLLKKNGAWRRDPWDWKIPTEEGIFMAVAAVTSSDQPPELAIPNMSAHCSGMLSSRAWEAPPIAEDDSLEQRVIDVVRGSEDPAVRAILLVGLASSPRGAARDMVVAATADAHLGVRKAACFLVQRRTARYFGPIGVIHMGSPKSDVDMAGAKVRAIYRWDPTLGAGWGPMRGGLQTRLAVERKVALIGEPIEVSLLVRNVSDQRVSLPNKPHPVRHFKVLCNKEYVTLTGPMPEPLPSVTVDPGKQVEYWTFVVNDHFKVVKPGKYEIWLADTFGLRGLLPRSNRVDLTLQPAEETTEEK